MKYIYLLFFIFWGAGLFAQPGTVIFSEDMGDPGDDTILVFLHAFQNKPTLAYAGNSDVRSSESSNYPLASAKGNVFLDTILGGFPRFFSIGNINTQNYNQLELSFGIYKSTDDSNGSELLVDFSYDLGMTWLPLPSPNLPNVENTATWHYVTYTFTEFPVLFQLANRQEVIIRWRNFASGPDAPHFRLDDVILSGNYTSPVISPSVDSINFGKVVVNEADTMEYTVSANFLIQDVEIESDNPSFELLDTLTDTWVPSIILTKGAGIVLEPVTIKVRYNPLNAVGDETAILSHSTFGAQDTIVILTGTSLATEPEVVTPSFTATANANGLIQLIWSPGDGDRRLIIARAIQPIEWEPVDGVSPLSTNENFSEASEIDGHKFVFDTDNSINQATIFGLNPATTYHFAIFEYNVGTGNSQNYLTDEFLVAQALTPFGPPGLQISESSTAFLINFQETVPGVLNGAYNGSGLSPSNVPGRLNTASWRVSLNNGTGGSTNYNSPATSLPNFGKGTNPGPSATNGIYAFLTGDDNIALGVKPFVQTNNNVFSTSPGGFFELRSQNKTNETVTEAYVSFVYYVFNNGNFSTDFKFSYSIDGVNFIDLSELDLTTPLGLEMNTVWKKHLRSVKIPGLSIGENQFLFIRWSGQDGQGSDATRDAIAIDDITIAFNPEPDFAGGSFSGIVSSGILAANAQLSDSAVITDSLILQDGAVLSTGVHALTLGPDVTIDESDGYIKGNLLVSRVIEEDDPQTFGGIGLSITTPVEAGLTQVKRVTGSIVPSSNLPSILRYFEISPEINTGLNASVAFTFEDFEVPFVPDNDNFRLFRRPIGSTGSWTEIEGGLSGNTYTVSGINSFNIQLTGADPDAPLPLDWLSFDVLHDKGFNLLRWVTANEVNTSSFEIEKSYDGLAFSSVSMLPARGGAFSESYEYLDKHDRSGLIYYRIKQIDKDHKFSYSVLRSVRAEHVQKLRVYPTAVSNNTGIFSDKEMEAQISIVNAQGAIVKQFNLQISQGEQNISVSDLTSGVYWIKIENAEISETFRIVKQ